jgi:membrane protease YdiL (CAAX protease family)
LSELGRQGTRPTATRLFSIVTLFKRAISSRHVAWKTLENARQRPPAGGRLVLRGFAGVDGQARGGGRLAFFLKSSGITWNQAFGFSQPPVGRAIIFGVFAALVFLPVGMFLQAVSIKVLTSWHVAAPPQAAVEEFNKNAAIINRVYLAFFAIAIAPIVEEILFRGVLYASLKMIFRKLGENLRSPLSTESGWRTTFREALVASLPWLAMPLSALAFAAIHLSAQIFLPIFVLGLLLAWLYEKTGNLLAPVTAHTLFNAINVALLLYGDNLEHLAHPSVTAPQ